MPPQGGGAPSPVQAGRSLASPRSVGAGRREAGWLGGGQELNSTQWEGGRHRRWAWAGQSFIMGEGHVMG